VSLRFASLGSGSKGNATVIQWSGGTLLVDCGFSAKEAVSRLQRLGIDAADLTAILVTHEHGDHIKGVAPLARRFNLPVHMTAGTYHSTTFKNKMGELPDLHLIEGYQSFRFENLQVYPVAVPHDAREPCQFIFQLHELRLGILTDLGCVSHHVETQFNDCDGLLVEANHDAMMLASGVYPPSLKQRVGGPWGHLNNSQTALFLDAVDLPRLQHLVIAHISQKNNTLELVQQALAEIVDQVKSVTWACQEQGFEWLELQP